MNNRRIVTLWFILACVLWAPAPGDQVKAQSPNCSSYDFPRGNWYIGGASTTISGDSISTQWLSQNYIYAILSLDTPINVYSVTVRWNPGVTVLSHFSKLTVATNTQDDSGTTLVESRSYPYNGNKSILFNFLFTRSANRIDIVLNAGETFIPAIITSVEICETGGIPPAPTSTEGPTATAGGPTSTNTYTPSPTRTPTPSLTPSGTPTRTLTPGAPTAGPSPTSGPSATPGTGTPWTNGGGGYSTIAPPLACDDPLHPCGVNPFMPNGIQPYPTVHINTVIPVTSVNTLSAPVTSGPTSTGTVTPDLSTGQANFVTQVSAFATGIGAINSDSISGLGGTPGSGNFGLLDLNGNPMDIYNTGSEIGSRIGDLFGVVRSVQSFFLGKLGNILAFALLIVGFVITVEFTLIVVRILKGIFYLLSKLFEIGSEAEDDIKPT